MSESSIIDAMLAHCQHVKNADRCCNNMLCRDVFSSSMGIRVIRELRHSIWEKTKPLAEGQSSKEVSTGVRRSNLVLELRNRLVLDCSCDGVASKKKIQYTLNGTAVCKSFFKVIRIVRVLCHDFILMMYPICYCRMQLACLTSPLMPVWLQC